MRKLIVPLSLAIFAIIAMTTGVLSKNALLWMECIAAAAATILILGGRRAHLVLLWICGIMWLQISGDVLLADIDGLKLADVWLGSYRVDAINYSLAALIFLAFGMRFGVALGRRTFRSGSRIGPQMSDGQQFRFDRLMPCYFVSWGVMPILSIVGRAVPGLEQAILTVGYLRFVFLFLIALHIFERNRGFQWLLLIMILEIVLGLTSYFADFTKPLFIIIFAFIASGRSLNLRATLFSGIVLISLFWLALIWTAIKPDFRASYGERDLGESLAWITDRVLYQGIDYRDALHKLVARIGYTSLYSQVLARSDAGIVPQLNLYQGAIEHILKPRLFFPNKAALNDSIVTTAMTGITINEETSIGVGFVAEAQADFGFPYLLIPIGLIGVLLGWILMYFLTRPVPLIMRHAVAIAALFTQFSYAANIDKALGGCIITFVGMALQLKFGYPLVGPWLLGTGRERPPRAAPSRRNVPT